MAARLEYIYQSLSTTHNQIRLLQILPTKRQTDPNVPAITLEVFNLETAPEYNALSYEWGSSDSPRAITIDGRVSYIGQNLCGFISTFHSVERMDKAERAKSPTPWLWIDQICIDQANIHEKSRQVMLMGRVYSQAKEVLMFLGTQSSRDSELFKQALEQISRVMDGDLKPGIARRWLQTNKRNSRLKTAIEKRERENKFCWGISSNRLTKLLCVGIIKPEQVELLQSIYRNTYWSRHWILQEFALAQTPMIVVGSTQIPWKVLTVYCQELQPEPKILGPILPQDLRDRIELFFALQIDRTPWQVWRNAMESSESSNCSDLRDKVYGIQGLFRPHLRIKTDYAASVRDVFRAAACLYIKQFLCKGDFAVHSYAQISLGLAHGLAQLAAGMGLGPPSNSDQARNYAVSILVPARKQLRTKEGCRTQGTDDVQGEQEAKVRKLVEVYLRQLAS